MNHFINLPIYLNVHLLQKLSGKCNPKFVMDGVCKVTFNFASEETKVKNVFKTKRCFFPFRADVKEIVGKFVDNNLQVFDLK